MYLTVIRGKQILRCTSDGFEKTATSKNLSNSREWSNKQLVSKHLVKIQIMRQQSEGAFLSMLFGRVKTESMKTITCIINCSRQENGERKGRGKGKEKRMKKNIYIHRSHENTRH